ncbi:hypothetical protein [Hymenobacter chitinivorans]|uniref:Gliding motility-associated lipoprotein GldH n=1 Tax=Hymenobacter chitinivorans DSM 11115 TaxID=1121954 RepID=A0A2M9AQU7_9BACT|nr:hypothetical protein [Hymenobacter chitinivorans]PJJ48069.1 hypothetical protein CLV45_4762 [Hymenobacter chitinivorans DSM 11115]
MNMLLPALLLGATIPAIAQSAAPAATVWTDHRRALPDPLRRVPVGLQLWHTPNPNYPEPDPAQPGHFLWKHSTMVRNDTGQELEIVACGSFIWYSEAGWQANLTETPAEFAELFNCPRGRLKPGATYTFAKNYRYASSARSLYGGDALWYILAKDASGKLYKGLGLIETEADVLGK